MLSFPTASLLLFIAITNIPTGLAAKECYLPNGLPPPAASDELIPCKAYGTVHSACCKNGQACSSNGLCQAPHERDRFWRGGCTDITFNDPACPRYCLVNGQKTAPVLAFQCTETTFCCTSEGLVDSGSNTTCCHLPERVFTAGVVLPYTIITAVSTSLTTHASTATTVSSAATTTSTNPTASSNSVSTTSTPNNVSIAVVVFVSVIFLLMAGVLFLFWRNRRQKKNNPVYQKETELPGSDPALTPFWGSGNEQRGAQEMDESVGILEMHSSQRYEMHSLQRYEIQGLQRHEIQGLQQYEIYTSHRHEIGNNSPVVELSTSGGRRMQRWSNWRSVFR